MPRRFMLTLNSTSEICAQLNQCLDVPVREARSSRMVSSDWSMA